MDIKFTVKGSSLKTLESQAEQLADRFFGYTPRIKTVDSKGEEIYKDNPEPRPYLLTFETAYVLHRDSYDPTFEVRVLAASKDDDNPT